MKSNEAILRTDIPSDVPLKRINVLKIFLLLLLFASIFIFIFLILTTIFGFACLGVGAGIGFLFSVFGLIVIDLFLIIYIRRINVKVGILKSKINEEFSETIQISE